MAVFYSFHYDRDAWRVQQIMKMGQIEGQSILNSQEWEEVKRKGAAAIEKWIAAQMAYKSAVVVLVGAQTASRPWVRHEIKYAWNNQKPLLGVRIHGLEDRNGNSDFLGDNPFTSVTFQGGGSVGDYVPIYNPSGRNGQAVYADIMANLTTWVSSAYRRS